MYRSDNYKFYPSLAGSALLPAFACTKILYVVLAICVFLTCSGEFTADGDNYSSCGTFNMSDSALQESRVFTITIDEWDMAASGSGFRLEEIQKSCSGRTHHENTAMLM